MSKENTKRMYRVALQMFSRLQSKTARRLKYDVRQGTGACQATANTCGQGIRGAWELNPFLSATVQDLCECACACMCKCV
jgi:hypothetical protein